jgi:hypothetical protein
MLRTFLGSLAVLAFLIGGPLTVDGGQKKEAAQTGAGKVDTKEHKKATITKVDKQKGTLTVKMKGKDGKEKEKTFKLTEDIRMFDSTGRAAVIDVFRSGDEVLVIEAEGKLREMRKHDKTKAGGTTTNPK